MESQRMKVAIVGAASEACAWHWPCIKEGIACEVFEAVPEVREIGAGITLLPHAMRELSDLGLQPQLEALAIENLEKRVLQPLWPVRLPRAARPPCRL
jgi:hypothetical protein